MGTTLYCLTVRHSENLSDKRTRCIRAWSRRALFLIAEWILSFMTQSRNSDATYLTNEPRCPAVLSVASSCGIPMLNVTVSPESGSECSGIPVT